MKISTGPVFGFCLRIERIFVFCLLAPSNTETRTLDWFFGGIVFKTTNFLFIQAHSGYSIKIIID